MIVQRLRTAVQHGGVQPEAQQETQLALPEPRKTTSQQQLALPSEPPVTMNPMGSPRTQHFEHKAPAGQAPPVSHFLHSGGRAAGAASLLKNLMRLIATWGVVTTILLNVLANHYLFNSIDDVRDAYVAHGAAARIKANALRTYSSIFAARDAVHYAIRTKLYYEPLDYVVVEGILAPIFASTPSIYTMDIAFSDRPYSIVMRRLGEGVLIQSDAPDCHLIGVMGCKVSNETAHEAAWYQVGLEYTAKEYRNLATSSSQALYKWVGPEFISRIGSSVEGASNGIAWAPSYSLVFYTVFPGTMDKLYAVGKVTMDLRKMGREVLSDSHLGQDGKVYICNKMGQIVAATRPAEQVLISPSSGTVHFREIWKLKDAWAKLLNVEVFRSQADARFELGDGTLVIVSPFSSAHEGMSDFFVVIVAGRRAFTDSVLEIFCILAFGVASMPYLITLVIFVVFVIRRRTVKAKFTRRLVAIAEAKRALEEVGNALQQQEEE